jgi:hypothetical protein
MTGRISNVNVIEQDAPNESKATIVKAVGA